MFRVVYALHFFISQRNTIFLHKRLFADNILEGFNHLLDKDTIRFRASGLAANILSKTWIFPFGGGKTGTFEIMLFSDIYVAQKC